MDGGSLLIKELFLTIDTFILSSYLIVLMEYQLSKCFINEAFLICPEENWDME